MILGRWHSGQEELHCLEDKSFVVSLGCLVILGLCLSGETKSSLDIPKSNLMLEEEYISTASWPKIRAS